MLNPNQGTRDAGNNWWKFLRGILRDYGLHPMPVDHAFFVKEIKNSSNMLISVATDDLLCTVPTYRHAEDFIKYMEQFFQLGTQKGHILKILGLRIIQTSHCILCFARMVKNEIGERHASRYDSFFIFCLQPFSALIFKTRTNH